MSFEYYPMINGTWLDASVAEIFNDLLQQVLLPYVRTAYNCKSCAVGDILIRRWLSLKTKSSDSWSFFRGSSKIQNIWFILDHVTYTR